MFLFSSVFSLCCPTIVRNSCHWVCFRAAGTQFKIAMGKQVFPRDAAAHRVEQEVRQADFLSLPWADRPVLLYWCVAENELSASGCCILCEKPVILALSE